jgi:hypothetical protein
MAKHRARKKPSSSKKSTSVGFQKKPQQQSDFDDPINAFFQAYAGEDFDDYQATRDELNKLRELVSQTLHSNNRYRAEILESYNILSKLMGINTKLNSLDFRFLSNNDEVERLDELRFDLKLIKASLDKINQIDDDLNHLNSNDISRINQYLVKHLKISDYLFNNGFLLIKIYYKILNLKNFLGDKVLNFYIKARLLVIYFELQRIDELLDAQPASIVKDQQDFKSVLISYKDFVLVLINQLNDAIKDKNTEQINECLNILKDVEKMYESFRMNFLFEQELEEYNLQIMEEEYDETSTPSTTASSKTTITAELPYLLQAFDEARNLNKEVATYTEQNKTNPKTITGSQFQSSPSPSPSPSQSTLQPNININNQIREPSHNHSHLSQKKFGVAPHVGFNNNLLNSIYGLNPKGTAPHGTHFHNEVD